MENKLQTIQAEDLMIVPTKSQIETAVDSIYFLVEEGKINPLQALATLSAFEKAFGDAKKSIMDFAITEAEKYPTKTIEMYGASFQLKESGVKYDYSHDDEWNQTNGQIKALTAQLKGRETVLKSIGKYEKYSTPTVSVILGK